MYIACSFVKKKKHWIFTGSQEHFICLKKLETLNVLSQFIGCENRIVRTSILATMIWAQCQKTYFWHEHQIKTQVSLHICTVWSDSSLSTWRNIASSQSRWLSWMLRPTGDQEVAGSTPAEVSNILAWRLIMKYFLRSFSSFGWFKKGSCQFLAKERAQYRLTA